MNTHVLLISGQVIPNLTPLLDPQIKPQSVIMLVSEDMKTRANWLSDVIHPQGIRCKTIMIENPWDIQQIRDTVTELIIENSDKQLVLNATGGTKPMSIAAYEEFRLENLPIYYVHPDKDELIWLHQKNEPSHLLASIVKLEIFLRAHGEIPATQLDREAPDVRNLEIAGKIISNIQRYQHGIRKLNYYANSAEKSLVTSAIDDPGKPKGPFIELIELFAKHKLLKLVDHRLKFPDERARFFVNGGWLEAWFFDQVRQLKKNMPEIQDYAYNIEVGRETERGRVVKNELDAAILYKNRLHIIECKTRIFRENEGTGADAIYKLDTLKELAGGLQARAILVSVLDVPGPVRIRAADLGISVCSGLQLNNAQEHLKKFLT